MNARLPPLALLLGVAGLVPFIVCGAASLAYVDSRALALLQGLIGYGAVVLSFLGGVHWGMVLSPGTSAPGMAAVDGPVRRERQRLLLGVAPSLIGWLALLTPLLLPVEVGLAVLIAGFVMMPVLEARLQREGLVASGYMWMRWGLSLVVVATLVTVLVIRLIGGHLNF